MMHSGYSHEPFAGHATNSSAPYPSNPQYQTPDPEIYLQQLESTILNAATTGSPESSHRLDVERCQNSDGLAGACLELLRRRGWGRGYVRHDCHDPSQPRALERGQSAGIHDAVTFYALTTLQRSPILSCIPPSSVAAAANGNINGNGDSTFSALRFQLRQLLLLTISHPPTLCSMPQFISTKVGVLLALLVREEYPMNWACPWGDVLDALNASETNKNGSNAFGCDFSSNAPANGGVNGDFNGNSENGREHHFVRVDMYLRFLDAVSDEIVYPAAVDDPTSGNLSSSSQQYAALRREQVKDALRGFPIKTFGAESNNTSTSDSSKAVVEPCIPLEHTDTARIIGWMIEVITSATANANTRNANCTNNPAAPTINEMSQAQTEHNSLLTIAVRAAATLKRYLSWVDFRLVTHPNLVSCLLENMGGASSGNPSTGVKGAGSRRSSDMDNSDIDNNENDDSIGGDEDGRVDPTPETLLAVECAQCLTEIITRGMDEEQKLQLLSNLNVFGTLCEFSGLAQSANEQNLRRFRGRLDLSTPDSTQIEAVIAAAQLINAIGLDFIPCWELGCKTSSTPTADSLMGQCMELTFSCLAYDDIDVSGAVVDLVSRVLVSLEKNETFWNRNNNIYFNRNNGSVPSDSITFRILSILYERMKYEPGFKFDYEDEDEAEEELYRSHLRKLYQRIVRFRPQMTLQFIGARFASLSQPLSHSHHTDIEVSLRLVHHFGEGRRPAPGVKTALRDAPFREILTALHHSDISSHTHREVLLLYYDLSVRYSSLLRESPELLSRLLSALTGTRGLQHPETRVRSRCCYLLLRLVKSIGGATMVGYVEIVVEGIQNLLFPPSSTSKTHAEEIFPIPSNDALYLFETVGILLGTTGLDADVQVSTATAVLTPHIQSIERVLRSPDLNVESDHYCDQLSMSVSAIAQLSKGWQKHPPPQVQAVLAAAVQVCRNVLLALPSSPMIRNRTSVLLQRMILCLGEGVLLQLPEFLSTLLSHSTLEEDVLDVSQLILQLCTKFKEKAAPAVDIAIIPFLEKVMTVQATGNASFDNLDPGTDKQLVLVSPPHLLTEQLSIRKHAFSTLQHIACNNVSFVLYSERNIGSMGNILELMKEGAVEAPDPVMKKTCISFFYNLITHFGYTCDDLAHQSVPPQVKDGFFDFMYTAFIPCMLQCILRDDFNMKDAQHSRVVAEFGKLLWNMNQSKRDNCEFQSRFIDRVVLGKVDRDMATGNPPFPFGSPVIGLAFQNAASEKEVIDCLKAWKNEIR